MVCCATHVSERLGRSSWPCAAPLLPVHPFCLPPPRPPVTGQPTSLPTCTPPTPVAEKRAREILTTDDYVSCYQQFQVELKFSLQLFEENGMAEEDRRAVEAGAAMMQVRCAGRVDCWAHWAHVHASAKC